MASQSCCSFRWRPGSYSQVRIFFLINSYAYCFRGLFLLDCVIDVYSFWSLDRWWCYYILTPNDKIRKFLPDFLIPQSIWLPYVSGVYESFRKHVHQPESRLDRREDRWTVFTAVFLLSRLFGLDIMHKKQISNLCIITKTIKPSEKWLTKCIDVV